MYRDILLIIITIILVLGLALWYRSGRVERYEHASGIHSIPGGYIIYDIEDEGVRCMEHVRRRALTCWSN